MNRVEDYLAISPAYCRWLGDLRWCPGGEAVEYACEGPEIGMTFAMAAEIALFLEGFQTSARPISFSFVLHLLHLLGLGSRLPRSEPPRRVVGLEKAFRESGLPFRNAGALCGMLCRAVPPDPGAPAIADICQALSRPLPGPLFARRFTRRAVVPPLDPPAFESLVLNGLAALTPQQVRHWLRFGRGPIGDDVGRIGQELPRSLPAALESLSRRPRFAGSGPLVAQLSGALTLPPRRLAASELPTGGYSDVSTRGLPEQILPGQLALDADEFVRRFAQHELLYFHREEPRAPVSDEMVIVLDQGVRTWGDVRLVLGAGVLAMGRHAARRGISFLVAATSHGGGLIDPLRIDREELGSLLEASDLTPHPGLLLERVLESPAGSALRDVVLLTHPRTLGEPNVAAAARRAASGTRLFAITVDSRGQVELAELRHGTPLVRSRCRVEIPGSDAKGVVQTHEATAGPAPWDGDFEKPPFPFRLGALSPIPDHLFDFDDSGDWILFAGQHGLLHAWRTDGSGIEMLPRAAFDGRRMSRVDAIVGVVGGFAVAGRNGKDVAVAHYDFSTRTCRVHPLPGRSGKHWDLSYLRELDSVVARLDREVVCALDLKADTARACCCPGSGHESASARAKEAYVITAGWLRWQSPSVPGGPPTSPQHGRSLGLHQSTGSVELRENTGQCQSMTPTTDGRPSLLGCSLRMMRFGGNIAAALIGDRARASIYFFSLTPFRVIGECPVRREARGFALSRDGRRFARLAGSRHIEVREVAGGPAPLAVSPKGMVHQAVAVELGESFLTIDTGKFSHLVRWDRRVLEFAVGRDGVGPLLLREFAGNPRRRLAAASVATSLPSDSRRFVATCSFAGLTLMVDFLGHVVVADPANDPIAMFYAFRDRIAVWMPDGTYLGPTTLTGCPAVPGSAQRIGAALAACLRPGWGSPVP